MPSSQANPTDPAFGERVMWLIRSPSASMKASATPSGASPRRLNPTGMKKYDFHMSVERITVSLETELAAAVRDAADADAQNVSSWLADAARRQLAARGLLEVVAAWEEEHGPFDDAELAAARARIGT